MWAEYLAGMVDSRKPPTVTPTSRTLVNKAPVNFTVRTQHSHYKFLYVAKDHNLLKAKKQATLQIGY